MDGTVVSRILTTDSIGWNGLYGMHRADLLRVLAKALPRTIVRTGCRCIGFEQVALAARLKFANGGIVEADIVIGADGIHSALQKYVVEPAAPEYSGSRAYRGLVPSGSLPKWPRRCHWGTAAARGMPYRRACRTLAGLLFARRGKEVAMWRETICK